MTHLCSESASCQQDHPSLGLATRSGVPGLDELDAALGEVRAAGWPAPEDPDGDDDAELDGRDLIADRLCDEVGWLRNVPSG